MSYERVSVHKVKLFSATECGEAREDGGREMFVSK